MTKLHPKNQPAVYIGLALTVVSVAATAVFHLSDSQWAHVLDAVPLVSGVVTRFFVSPAGRSVAEQVASALEQAQADAAESANRLAELQSAVASAMPAPVPVPLPAPVVVAAPVVEPAPAPVVTGTSPEPVLADANTQPAIP